MWFICIWPAACLFPNGVRTPVPTSVVLAWSWKCVLLAEDEHGGIQEGASAQEPSALFLSLQQTLVLLLCLPWAVVGIFSNSYSAHSPWSVCSFGFCDLKKILVVSSVFLFHFIFCSLEFIFTLCEHLYKHVSQKQSDTCLTLLKWSCSVMSDSLWPHGLGSPPGSSTGILQARILEWVAISFSRGSSWPRDWTQVSLIAGRGFNLWATREVPIFVFIYFFDCVGS